MLRSTFLDFLQRISLSPNVCWNSVAVRFFLLRIIDSEIKLASFLALHTPLTPPLFLYEFTSLQWDLLIAMASPNSDKAMQTIISAKEHSFVHTSQSERNSCS